MLLVRKCDGGKSWRGAHCSLLQHRQKIIVDLTSVGQADGIKFERLFFLSLRIYQWIIYVVLVRDKLRLNKGSSEIVTSKENRKCSMYVWSQKSRQKKISRRNNILYLIFTISWRKEVWDKPLYLSLWILLMNLL